MMSMTRIGSRFLLAASVALFGACGSKRGAKTEDHGEHGEGKEGHEEPKGVIDLTPEQVATAKIATAKVEKRAEAGLLEANAQIEAAADRQARVGARIGGRITAIKVGVGDVLKKGASLAVIDSPELGRAKADYLAALAGANVTRETSQREKALYEKRISSEKDWRESEAASVRARAEKEAAENRLHALGIGDAELPEKVEGHYSSTLSISAPIDGVVVERPAMLGQMVEPQDTLFVIMDLREVWILVDVYERDLSQVKVGQKVRVKVGAYSGKEFEGSVQNIGAIVEPKTRAVKIRVVLANPAGELKPGMFATVTVEGTTGEKREHLFAPAAAIQRDDERTIVFVPRGAHEFEPRAVRIGRSAGEWVEVEEGLAAGEVVVTTGSFLLKSELKKGELGGGHEH